MIGIKRARTSSGISCGANGSRSLDPLESNASERFKGPSASSVMRDGGVGGGSRKAGVLTSSRSNDILRKALSVER